MFIKEKSNIFNFVANTHSYSSGNYVYHEQLKGLIDINKFLNAFFSHALVPVFQNCSNFIERNYLYTLQ